MGARPVRAIALTRASHPAAGLASGPVGSDRKRTSASYVRSEAADGRPRELRLSVRIGGCWHDVEVHFDASFADEEAIRVLHGLITDARHCRGRVARPGALRLLGILREYRRTAQCL